MYTRSVPLKFL